MELGLILGTQYAQSRELSGVAAELTTQTELAREAGFDALYVSEHHVTDDAYLTNEAVLAYVAEHIGGMALGTCMCLLPYHNPVRIAEYGATMDHLTGGQFCLGIAQGYRPAEFAVFGVEQAEAAGRLAEGAAVIKQLWTESNVTFDGEFFQYEDISINPRPLQKPRPAILAGASNNASIRRAAHYADGWIGAHVPFETAHEQIQAFRDESENVEGPRSAGLAREVFVAETDEAAEAIVRDSLMEKYESYIDWGQDDVIAGDDFDSPWDKLKQERFLIGSPETVRGDIERYREELSLDHLLVRMQFPATDSADVRSSIQLFGDEVIPYVS